MQRLKQRLDELKLEYASGQKMLAELEAQQRTVRDTMLRISGAIQVLEELLEVSEPPATDANGHADGISPIPSRPQPD